VPSLSVPTGPSLAGGDQRHGCAKAPSRSADDQPAATVILVADAMHRQENPGRSSRHGPESPVWTTRSRAEISAYFLGRIGS